MHPANRLGLDYVDAARQLGSPPIAVVDVHAHINGTQAAALFKQAAELYGIEHVFSMTPLNALEAMNEVLGDMVHFIAIPDFAEADKMHAHGKGFLDQIKAFHEAGSRIVKFWAAPRSVEYGIEAGDPSLLSIDGPHRRAAMDLAASLGMCFMAHIADPDTWFACKYTDSSLYGTKADQYEAFERMLDAYQVPWIAAHMGGYPEDLPFLDGLLERHANLYLDTSATKWMVRELSRHEPGKLQAFLERWPGRILFGSDIVTSDDHLSPASSDMGMATKASTPAEAFDLYASRYWALRHLFETAYEGPSPIADPDLAMMNPQLHDELDAPTLRGQSLPTPVLENLYRGAAVEFAGSPDAIRSY